MKLSEYVKRHRVTYRTAWNRFKIGIRSSNPMLNYKRRSVLKMLIRAFLRDAKHSRPDSRAGGVVLSNPYFKNYLELLPKGEHGIL